MRQAYDLYETPAESIQALLPYLSLASASTFWEPTAGSGNILKAIKEKFPHLILYANELDPSHINDLQSLTPFVTNCDIRNYTQEFPNDKFDLIVGNPPYSLAQESIEACMNHLQGDMFLLLRLNFLGAQKRKSFWAKYPVTGLYVLSKRPSFTGKGTDSTEYAWFHWSKHNITKEIKVI